MIAHDASQDEAVFRQFADVARLDVTRTEPYFLVLSFLSPGTVSVIFVVTLCWDGDNDVKWEVLDSPASAHGRGRA